MKHLSKRLTGYLRSWYKTSTGRKAEQGTKVSLTFEQFASLFTPGQLMVLEYEIHNGTLRQLQNAKSKTALVLTWRSYKALKSNHFNVETAYVCSREASERVCHMVAGDSHTDEAKAKISEASKGKAKSEEHKEAISAACKGVSKAPWSEERKAARRAQIAARKAAQEEAA